MYPKATFPRKPSSAMLVVSESRQITPGLCTVLGERGRVLVSISPKKEKFRTPP